MWLLGTVLGANGREYGKLGANSSVTSDRTAAPLLHELWFKNDTKAELRAKLLFAPQLHGKAGAPSVVWLRISIGEAAERAVNLSFSCYGKSATRLPESAFVTFAPPHSGGGRWLMSKIGEWVSPLNSVDGAPHGLHGIDAGVLFTERVSRARHCWDLGCILPRVPAVIGSGRAAAAVERLDKRGMRASGY